MKNPNPATTGVLVVDNNRMIVSLNRKFIEMWGLPQPLIKEQNDRQAVKSVSSQLENPKSFLEEVREIYEQMDLEIYHWLFLRDGRIFERYTSPQCLEGEIVGRLWKFREISNYTKLNNLTFFREDDVPNLRLPPKTISTPLLSVSEANKQIVC